MSPRESRKESDRYIVLRKGASRRMREAAAALALAVGGDGHSSREKRRAFVALGKWAATTSDEELRADGCPMQCSCTRE